MLNETISKEMGLVKDDKDSKDAEVDNMDTKDNSRQYLPAIMAFPVIPPYPADGGH